VPVREYDLVELDDSDIVSCGLGPRARSRAMTKVQIRFRLQKALDDATLPHLAAAHAIYGIQKLKLSPSLDSVEVEYDATRLQRADVLQALSAAGVPVTE